MSIGYWALLGQIYPVVLVAVVLSARGTERTRRRLDLVATVALALGTVLAVVVIREQWDSHLLDLIGGIALALGLAPMVQVALRT